MAAAAAAAVAATQRARPISEIELAVAASCRDESTGVCPCMRLMPACACVQAPKIVSLYSRGRLNTHALAHKCVCALLLASRFCARRRDERAQVQAICRGHTHTGSLFASSRARSRSRPVKVESRVRARARMFDTAAKGCSRSVAIVRRLISSVYRLKLLGDVRTGRK